MDCGIVGKAEVSKAREETRPDRHRAGTDLVLRPGVSGFFISSTLT